MLPFGKQQEVLKGKYHGLSMVTRSGLRTRIARGEAAPRASTQKAGGGAQ